MRNIFLIGALSLVALGVVGCSASPPSIGERTSAIIGGTLDTADPAVVLLIAYPPDQSLYDTCTAEIIAPTVLITAAHCVDTPDHPDYIYGVILADDASAYPEAKDLAGGLLPVESVHAYPQYDSSTPFTGDVGVVVMASPLAPTPLPINRAPLTSAIVGQPARIVGYGQTVYETYNAVKYTATTTVASLDTNPDDTVTVGDATRHSCVGDSGGPALVEIGGVETIIGVDSYTDTTGCTEPSHYRRVDLYTSFFDSYLPAAVDLGTNDASSSPHDAATSVNDASLTRTDAASSSPPDASRESRGGHGCAFTPGAPPASIAWLCLLALVALARRGLRGA